MGDDPDLYRTLIPLVRLDRSRPSRPTGSRDSLVTEVAPLRDLILRTQRNVLPGFYYS
jgi:hypothetical protein